MMVRTFAEYVGTRRVTDSPRGDFIDDSQMLIRCGKFPAVETWPVLESFLVFRGAGPDTIRQARVVWRAFERRKVGESN